MHTYTWGILNNCNICGKNVSHLVLSADSQPCGSNIPPPINTSACKASRSGGHYSYLTTLRFPWISHTCSPWLPALPKLQHKSEGGQVRKRTGGLWGWRDPQRVSLSTETKSIARETMKQEPVQRDTRWLWFLMKRVRRKKGSKAEVSQTEEKKKSGPVEEVERMHG